MSFNPKLVPFERGTDFIYQRAMKNRRENNIADAIELMRRAVEASPENEVYRMDLAKMLSEAGCHDQSNRLLLDMMAEGERYGDCLYALAVNRLSQNDTEAARRLLDMCMAQGGELKRRALQLTGEIEMYESVNRAPTRRIERLNYIADSACDKLRREDFKGAEALFARALKMGGENADIRALHGMSLMLMGRVEDALTEIDAVIYDSDAGMRALCVASQVFSMADLPNSANGAFDEAMKYEPDPVELRMAALTAFELGRYEKSRELIARALFETPYDRIMLHADAANIIKMGMPQKEAAKVWRKITRLDSSDYVAEYFADKAENGEINVGEMNCEYQIPRAEQFDMFKYIAEKLEGETGDITSLWKNDDRFRSCILWCLSSGIMQFRETAVTLISTIDDKQAESVLREYMMRSDVEFTTMLRVMAMYHMRGADFSRLMPAYPRETCAMPDAGRVMGNLSVGHRQLIRLAGEGLEKHYNIYDLDRIAVMWDSYVKRRHVHTDVITDMEAGAAALAYCYLSAIGKNPDLYRLAKQFNASPRRLSFFSSILMAELDRQTDISGDSK